MTTRIHVNKDSSIHGTVRGGGMTLKVCMDSKKTTGNELKRRLDVLPASGRPWRKSFIGLWGLELLERSWGSEMEPGPFA